MTAAIVVTSGTQAFMPWVLTGTGFSNSTAYVVDVTGPTGVSRKNVTSDGSGGFTVTHVPQNAGSLTVAVRPLAETLGTTTAAATIAATTILPMP
jgi:hypothetical protein